MDAFKKMSCFLLCNELHWELSDTHHKKREVTPFFLFFPSLRDDWVRVGLCYPSDTTFQIMADINNRQSNTFDDQTDYGTVPSLTELEKRPSERKYFFDRQAG